MTNAHFRPWYGLAAFAVGSVVVLLFLSDNRYLSFVVGITFIHIVWATGMNLLYGYAGLMPMMLAGLAGISAYVTVALSPALTFWVAAPIGTLSAAVIGVVLGLPALRLRGFYFTLCSLVIQTVLTLAFIYFAGLTNGDTGISQIPPPRWFGGSLQGTAFDLVLAAAATIGIAVLIWIVGSDFGKRLVAIREDDELSETLGIDVTRTKMLVFFIGSLFAGVGGALYAPYVGFISPRSFDVLISLNIWLMVAFGGRGLIWGPVLGAALLAPIPYLLQDYYTLKEVIYGLLIILVIILLPGGLLRGLSQFRRAPEKSAGKPASGEPAAAPTGAVK
jgi:branched-chain amino acid transport system permease protein